MEIIKPEENKTQPLELNLLNFGRLRNQVQLGGCIVYYRKGMEELSLNITNACPNACTFCIRDHDKGWGIDYRVRELER